MNEKKQLLEIKDYIYAEFHRDETGHDFYHMKRVAKMSKFLAQQENANTFICEVAGWIHDIGDSKLFNNPQEKLEEVLLYLNTLQLTKGQISQIREAIKDISFSKGNLTPSTLEGKIVQDADRIDAIGAIGIARTFAYGGASGQLIYHPDDKNTSIQHFYDKLLKLKDSMNTQTGLNIAKKRHEFINNFLEQFFLEWGN